MHLLDYSGTAVIHREITSVQDFLRKKAFKAWLDLLKTPLGVDKHTFFLIK